MIRGQAGPVSHPFQDLFEGRSIVGLSDWDLLQRYLDRRDEVAFEAIVTRHGPMVLGVCRRILGNSADSEDAFQAVFLILSRKGGTLRPHDPIGHWLYGVAYRVALRARTSAARRRTREQATPSPEVAKLDDHGKLETSDVIDEELARLPTKYRAPVVLCYLEGLTHEEAGQHLGWPMGTVKGRLSRARDLLKQRLSRRGLAPANSASLFALVRGSRAAVPPALLKLTIQVALASRSAGLVPVAVSSLASRSFPSMIFNKMTVTGAIALLLSSSAAVLAFQMGAKPGGPPTKAPAPVTKTDPTLSSESVADWVAGWPDIVAANREQNPQNKAVLGALEAPIAMNFPNDTPLEDFLSYIKQTTESPQLPKGIPIYVNPQGLQNADKTMASTVSINLQAIPLNVTLKLALAQLGLMYRVEDGIMIIDSDSLDDQVTPMNILEKKAIRGELTRVQYLQFIEMLRLRNEVIKVIKMPNPGGFQ